MSTIELYDRIYSWLWLYEHMPIPPDEYPFVTTFTTRVNRQWEREMLTDIAEMEVPIQLAYTIADLSLKKAIGYAMAGDRTKVNEIHDQLMLVMKYLAANYLHANLATGN